MAIEIAAKGKGVSVVTLAGHDAGNFVYTQDLLDLAALLATCASDKDLRALVITGRGNNFCSGRIGAKGLTRASEVAEDLNAILKVNTALNAHSDLPLNPTMLSPRKTPCSRFRRCPTAYPR
jgi:enoyl-CoA hydratase/carnithine racemase